MCVLSNQSGKENRYKDNKLQRRYPGLRLIVHIAVKFMALTIPQLLFIGTITVIGFAYQESCVLKLLVYSSLIESFYLGKEEGETSRGKCGKEHLSKHSSFIII